MNLFYYKKALKRLVFLVTALTMTAALAGCGSNISGDEEASLPPDGIDPAAVSDAPEQSPTPDPNAYTGPDIPVQPEAPDEFFADAAFMGNSLMDGFRLYSGLTTCDYYAATSMTVVGATTNNCIVLDSGVSGTLVQGLCQKPYGKIYILLGINEIGFEPTNFAQLYGEMLDTIIAAQPDCDIYLMGLTPVSASKSAGSDTFNMTRVGLYNDELKKLASDKQCYYMDLVDALAGDDGFLPAAETPDGVHMSTTLYQQWLAYVRTHYIPRPVPEPSPSPEATA